MARTIPSGPPVNIIPPTVTGAVGAETPGAIVVSGLNDHNSFALSGTVAFDVALPVLSARNVGQSDDDSGNFATFLKFLVYFSRFF
jgi:hypothetical protein